ncbi:MAG: sn-glycerol-3-phosphate ABC transporter ATP-binding protein UgpC, partial [Elusimicrobiota bacterium]
MSQVILKNVSKTYPGNVIGAKDVSLEIKDKEFCILVGPSGCGKTTTLRLIAGLEDITKGEIYIDDTLVNDIPPKDRDIAMVFQNYALYPHMTVYENMSFGLSLRHYPEKEISDRVNEAANMLGIIHLLDRIPKALSGGQRQRVAVGRAIVRKPKVFLFDEPLSNLDAKLRVQMRAELKMLHERLQATMIYVTHDQIEAMTMGDKICVMRDGIVQHIATPLGLYNKPANRFVAGFIGSPPMNFLECGIEKTEKGVYLNEGKFKLKVPEDLTGILIEYIGKRVVFGMRPEDIYDKLYAPLADPESTITATVEVVEPLGNEIHLHLTTGKQIFVARVDAHNQAQSNQDIELVFNMRKMHIFDIET